jgi:hypothetical protein
MFRHTNARHNYGIFPAWEVQDRTPEPTNRLFSAVDFSPAILFDLQGFADDLVTPEAALRLRPIAP